MTCWLNIIVSKFLLAQPPNNLLYCPQGKFVMFRNRRWFVIGMIAGAAAVAMSAASGFLAAPRPALADDSDTGTPGPSATETALLIPALAIPTETATAAESATAILAESGTPIITSTSTETITPLPSESPTDTVTPTATESPTDTVTPTATESPMDTVT